MRVVFMGTPDFAVPTLRAVADAGHEVACVYSQPPRRAGRRGLALTPSPVHRAAEELGLPVRTPIQLRDEAERDAFAALQPDIAVVVAYGLLLPRPILDAPRFGCINAHGSLLPRWRGAAPIQRAVEAGDAETGVMVMRMETGLDTGPVAVTRTTPIGPSETAGEVHDRLAPLAAEAIVEALERIEAGTAEFRDQDTIGRETGRETLYARKIDKSEARIDFSLGADTNARKINAFSPFPGAFAEFPFEAGRERVKLLRATAEPESGEAGEILPGEDLRIACGTGSIRLLDVQRAGGRPITGRELMRGARFALGARAG